MSGPERATRLGLRIFIFLVGKGWLGSKPGRVHNSQVPQVFSDLVNLIKTLDEGHIIKVSK